MTHLNYGEQFVAVYTLCNHFKQFKVITQKTLVMVLNNVYQLTYFTHLLSIFI